MDSCVIGGHKKKLLPIPQQNRLTLFANQNRDRIGHFTDSHLLECVALKYMNPIKTDICLHHLINTFDAA